VYRGEYEVESDDEQAGENKDEDKNECDDEHEYEDQPECHDAHVEQFGLLTRQLDESGALGTRQLKWGTADVVAPWRQSDYEICGYGRLTFGNEYCRGTSTDGLRRRRLTMQTLSLLRSFNVLNDGTRRSLLDSDEERLSSMWLCADPCEAVNLIVVSAQEQRLMPQMGSRCC
jgi:hypothetical protein